jgi:transposase
MAYSVDLRKKVLEVQSKNNWNNAQTAKHFGISTTSVVRWNKNVEKKANVIRPQIKIDLDALKKDLEERKDDYIHERAKRFNVSVGGMHKAIKKLGFSNKKKSRAS